MAKTRASAARAVAAVLSGRSLSDALPPLLQPLALRDRALAQELAYGVLREFEPLAFLADGLLKARPKPNEVFALILVGLYQLLHTRVPEHAAVHATVEAAAVLKAQRMGGLINGVLRNFMREKDARLALLEQAEPAVQHALPRWLWTRINQDWPSNEQGEPVAEALRQHAPMTLRVNVAHGSREAYLARLQQAGLEAEPTRHAAHGIRLLQGTPVERLPGFAEGDVSVQDEAAQLCAQLLDLKAGMRVLDACAAPGGKTLALLEKQPMLDMLALDSDAQRLQRVEENLARARLGAKTRARTCAGDAGNPSAWWDGQPFDVILLDAPCSATGVIRRHPDIKRLRRAEDIAQLAAQQDRLLKALWPLLAPGGRLLYMTCSLLREENEARVTAFLDEMPQGSVQEISLAGMTWGRVCAHGRQILAGEDGMDGFYYALLEKPA
ncbi:MAG: 16S rRNA (cytosine(967)-C(5))-methyltransferase [Gammaproteobacteria bacterium 28-57-27]|nr:MAG: 16S rRNA (cytosine(967)-C(5))-methyltransferase [Gammaproteobacteria bacterium 28-57-27]